MLKSDEDLSVCLALTPTHWIARQDPETALLPRGGMGLASGSRLPPSQYHRSRTSGLPRHPLPPQPGSLQQAGDSGGPGVPQHHLAGVGLLLRVAPHLACHHLGVQEEIHEAGGGGGG